MRHLTGIVTVSLLILLCGTLALRDQLKKTFAADGESVTWGATDPAWSPDGRKLAFSLFGSIWQVSAEGGQAEQVSTSTGYHAHPAWSPEETASPASAGK